MTVIPDCANQQDRWLTEAFAEASLLDELIHAVQELDTRPIANLLNLLAKVRPAATFRKTRHGIQ